MSYESYLLPLTGRDDEATKAAGDDAEEGQDKIDTAIASWHAWRFVQVRRVMKQCVEVLCSS